MGHNFKPISSKKYARARSDVRAHAIVGEANRSKQQMQKQSHSASNIGAYSFATPLPFSAAPRGARIIDASNAFVALVSPTPGNGKWRHREAYLGMFRRNMREAS
jgi:hypothetical protein